MIANVRNISDKTTKRMMISKFFEFHKKASSMCKKAQGMNCTCKPCLILNKTDLRSSDYKNGSRGRNTMQTTSCKFLVSCAVSE